MVPEGNNVTDVGSPGWVEAETAEVRLTETTPQEVITQPINCLIHLFKPSKWLSIIMRQMGYPFCKNHKKYKSPAEGRGWWGIWREKPGVLQHGWRHLWCWVLDQLCSLCCGSEVSSPALAESPSSTPDSVTGSRSLLRLRNVFCLLKKLKINT